jgi:hypothetical protein
MKQSTGLFGIPALAAVAAAALLLIQPAPAVHAGQSAALVQRASRDTVCATPLLEDVRQELAARFPDRGGKQTTRGRGGPYHTVGSTMTFWAWDLTVMPPAWVQQPATCRAVGDHCYVFVADDQWNVNMDQADVDLVVHVWDTATVGDPTRGIYEMDTTTFGPPPDSHDNDDWIYIYYSALGEFAGSVFDGYFSVFNQYTEAEAQALGGHSNEVEMFYMSCDPVDPAAASTLSVLAHEFEHMIHFNMDVDETTWVDEGCAEFAMYLYGLPDPIVSFPGNPDNDLTSWDQQFSDYIQTYLFMMYLHDHYGGVPALSALVAEPANSILGVENMLAGLGYTESFEEVMADWVIANYLDDSAVGDGRYGYTSIDLPDFSHSGDHVAYPVEFINRTVNHWAADYIRFRSGSDLWLQFDGVDSTVFGLQMIALDATSPTTVQQLPLDGEQDWAGLFDEFGGSHDTLVLVPCGLSSSGETGYQYTAYASGGLRPALIVGPGPGADNPTEVRGFTVTGTALAATDFDAYVSLEGYGTRVAAGDLYGTGLDLLVTGPGPGSDHPPLVRAFTGYGTPVDDVVFTAYGVDKYGVNVACGDLDGNGVDEIVTGAGPGAVFGPHVRGWSAGSDGVSPVPGVSFFAYGTNKFGVNAVCGDIDGDGMDEIVTGAGPGAVFGPHVRGWNVDGGAASSIPGISFFAYGTLKWGVNVACADIDGDGMDEILTGAGPGTVFGPHVRGWNYDGTAVASIPGVSFLAYGTNQYGVRVSGGDVDGDGIDEIITTPGPGLVFASHVRGWNYDGGTLAAMPSISFLAFDASLLYGADAAVATIHY